MHRIGRTGRVGRSGRAITFYEPRQAARDPGDRAPRGRQALAVGQGRARRADSGQAEAAPPLQAARDRSTETCPRRKLIVSGGRAAGLEPSDIIHAITAATGLDGEAVRNVRVLERFAFVEVPEPEAERVVEQVRGTEVRGHALLLEPARV